MNDGTQSIQMAETQTDLSVGVGMLSKRQAGSLIPFETSGNSDLLLQRHIARRSLPAVKVGNVWLIPADGLRAFLLDGVQNSTVRKSASLPMETLEPLFPLGSSGRNWFGPGPIETQWTYWRTAVVAELQNQFPVRILLKEQGLESVSPAILFVDSPEEKVTIAARPTPALVKLLKYPAPPGLPFANMAEYHLAKRLQELAWNRVQQRVMNGSMGQVRDTSISYADAAGGADLAARVATTTPSSGFMTGIDLFYSSPETYGEIAGQAAEDLAATASIMAQKNYPEGVPVTPYQSWKNSAQPSGSGNIALSFPAYVQLKDRAMMEFAGSNAGRLACLAF